jgi:hypothetical protein
VVERRQASCPKRAEPHPMVRRIRISVCRRSASLDYLANGARRTEKQRLHRSVLVRKPRIRASAFALCASADRSRGWKLQNSGAGAPRERNSIWRFDARMRKKCTEGDTNAARVIAPSPLAGEGFAGGATCAVGRGVAAPTPHPTVVRVRPSGPLPQGATACSDAPRERQELSAPTTCGPDRSK